MCLPSRIVACNDPIEFENTFWHQFTTQSFGKLLPESYEDRFIRKGYQAVRQRCRLLSPEDDRHRTSSCPQATWYRSYFERFTVARK